MDIAPVMLQFPTIDTIHGTISKFSLIPVLRNGSRVCSCLLLAYYVNDCLLAALPPPSPMEEEESPSTIDVETTFFNSLKLLEISARREVNNNLILPQLSQITESFSKNLGLKRQGFRATQDLEDFKLLFKHITTKYRERYKKHLLEALRLNLLVDDEVIRRTLSSSFNAAQWIKKYKENTQVEGNLFAQTLVYLEIYYQCPGYFQRLKRRINRNSEELKIERADACRWILTNLGFPDCYTELHSQFVYNCYQKLINQ